MIVIMYGIIMLWELFAVTLAEGYPSPSFRSSSSSSSSFVSVLVWPEKARTQPEATGSASRGPTRARERERRGGERLGFGGASHFGAFSPL